MMLEELPDIPDNWDDPDAPLPEPPGDYHTDELGDNVHHQDDGEDPAEPGAGDSWKPIDLASVIAGITAGTLERLAPTIGVRSDGAGMFYQGRVNGLAGSSGSGKSMIAMFASAQEIAAGNHVMYIDLEDDEAGTVQRLIDLGADPKLIGERFHYIRPEESHNLAAQVVVAHCVAEYRPTLVVVDSIGEAMALDGADPDKDPDTARWFKRCPATIASQGPAVVTLDHVTKADDGTGLWPIGSQRKRAAVTGALYMVSTIVEFSKGKPGKARLTCAKDRLGTYTKRSTVAEFEVEPFEDGITAKLTAPQATAGPFRPTNLMEKISRYLELRSEPATGRDIRDDVKGNKNAKDTALKLLIAEGHVQVTQVGQAHHHTSLKPYRETEDEPTQEAMEL